MESRDEKHGFNKNQDSNRGATKMTKTKIALVAAFVAGSATVASAQGFDPNPANRYPAYAGAGVAMPYLGQMSGPQTSAGTSQPQFRSAPVALRNGYRAAPRVQTAPQFQTAPVGLYQGPSYGYPAAPIDHDARPHAGGVG
jgi:hypothetical protein